MEAALKMVKFPECYYLLDNENMTHKKLKMFHFGVKVGCSSNFCNQMEEKKTWSTYWIQKVIFIKKRGVLTGSKTSEAVCDDIKNVASKLVTNGSAREWRMGMINELYIYRGDMTKKVYNSPCYSEGLWN
ncbi:Uncharacterized protein Fot_29886 [Forsythia ovata]|uniref:Uncharacterized protein n=1 Tax=Forsythia ovata TaxID=205694 RepID=A0ABD1TTZ6_9LAMI